MLTKLPYGLKEGKLVSIDEVEKGLACNCICPGCQGILVARKGEKNIDHFAHQNGGNCEGGIETALHLAAKEIIKEEKRIVIPSLQGTNPSSGYGRLTLAKSIVLTIDEVQLEVRLNDFQPDILAFIGKQKLIIEVAVTHFVNNEKYEKIKKIGISAIEIDLKDLKDGFTKDDLRRAVIDSLENKSWIYNAKEEDLMNFWIQKMERIAKSDEIARIKKLEEEKQKKYEIKKQGFDKIIPNQDGESFCPMSIQENSKEMGYNEFIRDLRNGKFWNGNIYGKGFNGKNVYIDNQKREFLPT